MVAPQVRYGSCRLILDVSLLLAHEQRPEWPARQRSDFLVINCAAFDKVLCMGREHTQWRSVLRAQDSVFAVGLREWHRGCALCALAQYETLLDRVR